MVALNFDRIIADRAAGPAGGLQFRQKLLDLRCRTAEIFYDGKNFAPLSFFQKHFDSLLSRWDIRFWNCNRRLAIADLDIAAALRTNYCLLKRRSIE